MGNNMLYSNNGAAQRAERWGLSYVVVHQISVSYSCVANAQSIQSNFIPFKEHIKLIFHIR